VTFTVLQGNALHLPLADGSVHMVCTSPPYWGLRDYGVPGQLGLEPTPEEYVANMVAVFREVWRVLRDDGTVWLNLGDSYAGSNAQQGGDGSTSRLGPQATNTSWTRDQQAMRTSGAGVVKVGAGLKPKDLIGIPWRVALALQADGWWLRSDIVWCLSGGTVVYARTQKGDMPMTVKDLARLDPATVQLWNGEKWTRLLGMNRNERCGGEIEMVLRSGERIACTPTHRFPTQRGLVDAGSLRVGDVLERCQLPEPEKVMDCAIDEDAAWLAGLYIAEGSMADDTIQIAGHVKEAERWERVQRIAAKYGGWATKTEDGNAQAIRLYGKVLCAILKELVSGHTAKDKGFGPHVWRYSNRFLDAMLDGYLSGDGHWDAKNNRWRLGFTRNYNLERDLRVVCARLGYRLTLNFSSVAYNGKRVPTFRGEIRKERCGHRNEKDMGEIVAIRKAKCRQVYDLGVADEPHLFALGSGVLTHNSKPNPMPESVTDRPTKAHEYLFLLAKSARYFYDNEAIKEEATKAPDAGRAVYKYESDDPVYRTHQGIADARLKDYRVTGRNRRTVWTIATQPCPLAHFATMPPALVEPCIKAGTSERGCCPACGAPWERVVRRVALGERDDTGRTHSRAEQRMGKAAPPERGWEAVNNTLGWQPTCGCPEHEPVPCVVLDPFGGAGTTMLVADRLGRCGVGVELSDEYCRMARRRCYQDAPLLAYAKEQVCQLA
jgi:hypothetical protein